MFTQEPSPPNASLSCTQCGSPSSRLRPALLSPPAPAPAGGVSTAPAAALPGRSCSTCPGAGPAGTSLTFSAQRLLAGTSCTSSEENPSTCPHPGVVVSWAPEKRCTRPTVGLGDGVHPVRERPRGAVGGGRGNRSGRASLGETALLAAGETGLLALGETALLSCAWEGTEWTDRERPRLWWRCVRLLLCGTRGVGDRRLCLGVLDRAPGDGSRLFASKSHNFSTTRHCSLERERDRPMHPQLSSPRAHCRKAFSFHNLSNPPLLRHLLPRPSPRLSLGPSPTGTPRCVTVALTCTRVRTAR